MTRFAKLFAFASTAVLAMASVAHADPIGATDTFFNTPTTALNLCCFQVKLTQESSTDMQLKVSLLDGAQFFAGTGNGTNHPGFAFDLSGLTSASTINVSLSSTDQSNTNWTFTNHDPASASPTSLGDFAFQLNTVANGGNTGVTTLTFDITGMPIAFADFVQNADGVYFVADILDKNGNTGLSGISHAPTVTPEPSSLFLLGTGILGAGLLVRRRIQVQA
jgi:hypothetical protein